MILKTGIAVNQPTIHNRLYPDVSLRKVMTMAKDKAKARVLKGGVLDPNTGKPQHDVYTHTIVDAHMIGGELCFEIEYIDDGQKTITDALGTKLRALPVIQCDLSVPEIRTQLHTIKPESILDIAFVHIAKDIE